MEINTIKHTAFYLACPYSIVIEQINTKKYVQKVYKRDRKVAKSSKNFFRKKINKIGTKKGRQSKVQRYKKYRGTEINI